MKKTILLTSIAVLTALSSCTMDEIKEVNQGTPIGFRTSVATRGIQVLYESDLRNFYCTAWVDDNNNDPYFNDLLFSYLGSSYTSAPSTYYWPKGKNLYFYAYAPSSDEMGEDAEINITKTVQTITGYQVPTNIDDQDDLIFASNQGTIGDDDTYPGIPEQADVPLNFAHMLSKIDIQVQSDYEKYEYNFKEVKIGGLSTKGTINLANSNWSDWGSKQICNKEIANPIQITSETGNQRLFGTMTDQFSRTEENYAFMIPQEFTAWNPETDPTNMNSGAYISLLVQINTVAGTRVYPQEGEYGWVAVPIPSGKWEAGYEYTYYLDFTNGAGYVDPENADLEAGTVGSILGNPIKITMEMTDIQDSNLGVVKNEDMIGYWEADYYHRTEWQYTNSDKESLSYIRIEEYVVNEAYNIDDINEEQPYGYYTYQVTDYDLTEYKSIEDIEDYDESEYIVDGEKIYKITINDPVITPYYDKDSYVNAINGRVSNFGRVRITDGTQLEIDVNNTTTITSPFYIEKRNVDEDPAIEYIMYIDAFKQNGEYMLCPIIETLRPLDGNTLGEGYLKGGEEFGSWDYVNELHYTISPL